MLTQTGLIEKLADYASKLIYLDAEADSIRKQSRSNLDVDINAHQPAFILGNKTSPQFQISHQNVVERVKGMDYAKLDAETVLLHHTPIDSAIATFEIWGSLLNGARLVIAPPAPLTARAIGQLIFQHQITTLWLPTRWFHQIVDTRLGDLKPICQLLVGGDILSVPQVQAVLQALPNCKLIQTYSSPSNPGFTCFYAITELSAISTAIPIGRPTTNTQVFILNRQHQPMPIGVPGELCVGGDQLTIVQPSSEAWIPHPFSDRPNAQLYQTGDLARYLPDGNIELVSVSDRSIKIGEWQIEFGRIETILSQHSAVQESVVLAREESPDICLVAYVVLKPDCTSTISDLRNYLKQKLPALMVPSAFVFLDSFPLTSNGNINHPLLPKPDFTQDHSLFFVASRDELEAQLIQIWKQLFNLSSIGIHD